MTQLTLTILVFILSVGYVALGWWLGRRAAAPPEFVGMVKDIAELKAARDTLSANDEALRESLGVIDEYLQKQAAKYANRETDIFGKLSKQIAEHLGVTPRGPEVDDNRDDSPKPRTKMESVL